MEMKLSVSESNPFITLGVSYPGESNTAAASAVLVPTQERNHSEVVIMLYDVI